MKFLQIDRYHESEKIFAITILGFRMDFRPWYQVWLNKGDDPFDKEYTGWSDVWLSWSELKDDLWYDRVEPDKPDELWEDVKRDTPRDLEYRKIPLIKTIINWNSWWYKNKKLLLGIIIGILISLIIK